MDIDIVLTKTLQKARHIVVFTGAGVSQESGIPTFRDTQTGLWQQYDAHQLATPDAFENNPTVVWGWYEWRRAQVLRCIPNAAHKAIARLADLAPQLTVVTQNVDNLHERAGNRGVLHLHGSLHHPRCHRCGEPYRLPVGQPSIPEGGRHMQPPWCPKCKKGLIRPGVVWFGETLPAGVWREAEAAVEECDVLLSVGTSSLVYPAAGLPFRAATNGACVVQINPNPTALDSACHHNLCGKAGPTLSALLQAAWPDAAHA